MRTNRTATRSLGTAAPVSLPETGLSIVVPFTSPDATRAALKHAVTLSAGLNAAVRLIDAQVVPMQRPLSEPPVNREFLENRMREIAGELDRPVQVEIVYTRDRLECFRKRVKAGSLIVVAAGIPWWPSAEKKLARSLLKAGYDVVLVPRN